MAWDRPVEQQKIFLSYSHADHVFATRLAEGLRGSGHEVWTDAERMAAGQPWRDAVDAALSQADSCVVLISRSTSAPEGNTSAEWSEIQDAVWRRPDLKVVPVVLGAAQLPPFLRPWRMVGPVSASEPQRAVEAVMDAIGAEDGRERSAAREIDEATRRRFDEIRSSLQQMRRDF